MTMKQQQQQRTNVQTNEMTIINGLRLKSG